MLNSGCVASDVGSPWSAGVAITRIPAAFRPGFEKIKKLSSEEVESISEALSKSPLRGGLRGAIVTVSAQVPRLTVEDIEDIVRALYSMYLYRRDSDTSLPKFVSELVAAMRSSGKELTLSEDEKGGFQDAISKLLNINTIEIASKAQELRTDYAITFHNAKILTDIRPIFGKPEDRPIGAAITYTLKIEYHERGEHKYFYVAMNADALGKMKKAIQRAELKASSLASFIRAASLSDLSKEESE